VLASIFLDFNLPNAATWFYFSLLLSVALFFQFSRSFNLRNWDLLALFLLVPGFLLLQEGHGMLADVRAGTSVGTERESLEAAANGQIFVGYLWLISASAYWFVRMVIDLMLVRRPLGSPNLNSAGLAWFGTMLFVCMCTVAVKRAPFDVPPEIGKRTEAITQVGERAAELVKVAQPAIEDTTSPETVRVAVELGLALACHFAVLAGLVLIGGRHFGDWTAGAAMATLYLLLPYTGMNVGQFHHVWPSAFIVWAVYFYRRHTLSGVLLGMAAGSAFFPLLLFPLWLGFYWRRGAGRFATAFLVAMAVSIGITGLALWIDGRFANSLQTALNMADWQAWKAPQTESLWLGAHWAYRLPVFVLFAGFALFIAIWPSPKNLAHLIALSAAVLIGVQFWYADRGGVYVLWYLPLVLLTAFRPNLNGHQPPVPEAGSGYLFRFVRYVLSGIVRWLSPPPRTPVGAA
jgi:hypothetical protein